MTDEAAFLAAIRDQPADDTVRLVYADWLEEHSDEPVQCFRCKGQGMINWDTLKPNELCPICKGSRSLRTRAHKAEFIRVQIQLSRLTPPVVLSPFRVEVDPTDSDEYHSPMRSHLDFVKRPSLQNEPMATLFYSLTEQPRLVKRGDVVDIKVEIFDMPPMALLGLVVDDVTLHIDRKTVEVRVLCGRDSFPDRSLLAALQDRQSELFTAHAVEWIAGLPGADKAPELRSNCVIVCDFQHARWHFEYVFQRGFPECPQMPPESWRLLHPPFSFSLSDIHAMSLEAVNALFRQYAPMPTPT